MSPRGVVVPRGDAVLLASAAYSVAARCRRTGSALEVGTGSGALPVTISLWGSLRAVPQCTDACSCALRTARGLSACGAPHALGAWQLALVGSHPGMASVAAMNPPYVQGGHLVRAIVARCLVSPEPHRGLVLNGRPYSRLPGCTMRWVDNGGAVCTEHGYEHGRAARRAHGAHAALRARTWIDCSGMRRGSACAAP